MEFEKKKLEYLYDAWERYKLIINYCPSHKLDDFGQLQYFTKGLHG